MTTYQDFVSPLASQPVVSQSNGEPMEATDYEEVDTRVCLHVLSTVDTDVVILVRTYVTITSHFTSGNPFVPKLSMLWQVSVKGISRLQAKENK